MGGRPISALSIVGFPDKGDPDVMEQIILGGLSKMAEAGCSVLGGHSNRDDDIKFGYAGTGALNPQRGWRNVGARPFDVASPPRGPSPDVPSKSTSRSQVPLRHHS